MLIDTIDYILSRSQEFTNALGQHLNLTFTALVLSITVGLLLGVVATRVPRLRSLLLSLANLGRTVPSLAVLALALPFLGIGAVPALVALVFIGALPVIVNTTVGIESVDKVIKEAARGMGMSDFQVLLQIELPISVAVIMAGVRTSAVVIVASATLASFIGGGGLGDLILRGHVLAREEIMLAGAIPATLLAFYFEEIFGRLQIFATPRGLKPEMGPARRSNADLYGLLAAALVLPLVFGVLLPWAAMLGSGGEPRVLTGLHPGFRAIGLPSLLLGLLAALWPIRPARNRRLVALLPTTGAAALAVILFAVQSVRTLPGLLSEQNLQIGFVLQAISLLWLAAITLLESRPAHPLHPAATNKPQTQSA